MARNLLLVLNWLARKSQASSCLHLPNTETVDTRATTPTFLNVGSEVSISHPHACKHLVIDLSPLSQGYFLCLFIYNFYLLKGWWWLFKGWSSDDNVILYTVRRFLGETAWLVQCLLCMHEDLSSVPGTYGKTWYGPARWFIWQHSGLSHPSLGLCDLIKHTLARISNFKKCSMISYYCA